MRRASSAAADDTRSARDASSRAASSGYVTATAAMGQPCTSRTATPIELSPGVTSPDSTACPRERTSRSTSRNSAGEARPAAGAIRERVATRIQRPHLLAREGREHRAARRGEVRRQPHTDVGHECGAPRRALLDEVEHIATVHDGEVRALMRAVDEVCQHDVPRAARGAPVARSLLRARTRRSRAPTAAPRRGARRTRAPRASRAGGTRSTAGCRAPSRSCARARVRAGAARCARMRSV